MSLKIYGVALGLCLFLLSSRLAFCQQMELVVDTTYKDCVRMGGDILFLSDDGNAKYKDGVITSFKDFDSYAKQSKTQELIWGTNGFYLLVQSEDMTYCVNSKFVLLPEQGIDLGGVTLDAYDARKDIVVVDNLVSYIRNDSIFVNDLYRPLEEYIDRGTEFVFKNRNFILIQQGEFAIIYSVKTKKKAKIKGSIARIDTQNDDLLISSQYAESGKRKIIALDQSCIPRVHKSAGYDYYVSNQSMAVFTKSNALSTNTSPLVFSNGKKNRISKQIKDVSLTTNYLRLETTAGTYGLMGHNGELLTDLSYDNIEGFTDVEYLKRDGVISLVNKQGEIVFDWSHYEAELILERMYALKYKAEGRYFVIDDNDNLIIDVDSTGYYRYTGKSDFGTEFIIAKSTNRSKLYDIEGNLLSEWSTDTPYYEQNRQFFMSENYLVGYDKEMLSNLSLETARKLKPSGIFMSSIKSDNHTDYFLVTHTGMPITPIYDSIKEHSDGLYIVKTLSGKIGLIKVSY